MKQADAELREKKSFEDLLPEVTQKCTLAEEYMEKGGAGGSQWGPVGCKDFFVSDFFAGNLEKLKMQLEVSKKLDCIGEIL